MIRFAAFCVLAISGYAFSIDAIAPMEFDDSFADIDKHAKKKAATKSRRTRIPQIPAYDTEA